MASVEEFSSTSKSGDRSYEGVSKHPDGSCTGICPVLRREETQALWLEGWPGKVNLIPQSGASLTNLA